MSKLKIPQYSPYYAKIRSIKYASLSRNNKIIRDLLEIQELKQAILDLDCWIHKGKETVRANVLKRRVRTLIARMDKLHPFDI